MNPQVWHSITSKPLPDSTIAPSWITPAPCHDLGDLSGLDFIDCVFMASEPIPWSSAEIRSAQPAFRGDAPRAVLQVAQTLPLFPLHRIEVPHRRVQERA